MIGVRVSKWALVLACVGLLTALSSLDARADRIDAAGARITKVTVYADRAEVIRQAQVQLPAGASEIVFWNLPPAVEPDSLRVSARGIAATLGAVELKDEAQPPAKSEEFIAAEKEVKRLEGELAALDAQDAVARDLIEYLRSLKTGIAPRPPEKSGEPGKLDPAAIQATYGLLKTNLGDLASEDLARRKKRTEVQEALQVARAKLDAARPKGPIRSRAAILQVETRQPGSLTVELSAVVPGAFWRPAYRAALDPAKSEIDLVSEAVVVQRSGEDWTDVALSLSTAAPARGVEPPVLDSWLLRPVEAYANEVRRDQAYRAKAEMATVVGAVAPAAAPAEQVEELEISQAEVVHSAYNVSFEAPGKTTVPADGREHRVTLRHETLPAEVAYRAVAPLQEAAFLVAKSKAPAAYPLLGGPVRVFAGPAYLGQFPLLETGPGAELKIPFGQDNRIAVKRVVLPQERTKEGFSGKDRQTVYAFKTTIENLRDTVANVVVEDRIPVSEDERIKVEIGEATTRGYTEAKDRPGILEWTLTLQPKEKKEIILEYSVRRPKDLVVPGL